MSEAETRSKICEMGYCLPGTLAKWKPQQRFEPRDANAEQRKSCSGVLADIVGRGMICLDPNTRDAREFRDCKDGYCGPVMVALPKGTYTRGTSKAEAERLVSEEPAIKDWIRSEQPAAEVLINYHVAVGKFELTFDEWEDCRRHFHCNSLDTPHDQGWGRGKRPVINISWDDITRAYLPWLNGKLGLSGDKAYRLLTDTEWEFAARAGTVTRYAFGDVISLADARFFDGPMSMPGRGQTADVGSFPPNAFGLHDMHGNVHEWVEDCFSFMNKADDLPVDGSARYESDCSHRAFRGGGYSSYPLLIRSASRSTNSTNSRMNAVGLRLARSLEARVIRKTPSIWEKP